jgi:hypothetical protein
MFQYAIDKLNYFISLESTQMKRVTIKLPESDGTPDSKPPCIPENEGSSLKRLTIFAVVVVGGFAAGHRNTTTNTTRNRTSIYCIFLSIFYININFNSTHCTLE